MKLEKKETCETCGTKLVQVNDKMGILIPSTYKCPNPECPNTDYQIR